MKHITILVPEGESNNLSSIVGAYKILTRANALWKENSGNALYKIELAGISNQISYYEGLFSVQPHKNISDIAKTHLIIIPSLNHNYDKVVAPNQPLIDWIVDQYKNGAEIASICTGAFLLAASGLLDGKKCSTHWAAANNFRAMFPKVDIEPDRLITAESGIYTNGGAYSFLNLIIYLVERYFDRPTAIFCSKVFQIEMNRDSQSSFIMFKGQKSHDDDVVMQAQNYIEAHFEEKIFVEELSQRLAVGRRNFDRRFIKETGNTPVEYMQRVRIEKAKNEFETSRKTVNEVMYQVGYSDMKAFREVFRKVTGMTPLDYRKKYNKESLF
ncbi:GlxA family transcriptional regulator [Desertivirga xinjiangensis]|uniref:GlxA family transcriptional regulator n=1 Tax=Desertivirga xinjiangensis TaxID=539206 RepID=UPI00210C35C9|nr:helix-turn-helix domain-containing protein [Pedobacter xinjiangensis]